MNIEHKIECAALTVAERLDEWRRAQNAIRGARAAYDAAVARLEALEAAHAAAQRNAR